MRACMKHFIVLASRASEGALGNCFQREGAACVPRVHADSEAELQRKRASRNEPLSLCVAHIVQIRHAAPKIIDLFVQQRVLDWWCERESGGSAAGGS